MANFILVNDKKVNMDEVLKLGEFEHFYPGDFEYVHEEIFLTRKGNYLFRGTGGAQSEYSRKISSNTWGGGSEDKFISREEAFNKLCNWGETETVLKYFSDMVEEA